jgi:ribosomal protein L37AE/L43A
MPVLRAKPGIWCDYCRVRYPKGSMNHDKPASWTVVSESVQNKGRERHYCQSCAQEASKWGDEIWELQDQINYAVKNMGERLDV